MTNELSLIDHPSRVSDLTRLPVNAMRGCSAAEIVLPMTCRACAAPTW